ncbi:MAG: hypothetical protein HWN80_02895 [Candidatus Lokiarchaeota archaeon]|nr:hypothetical protein [Candidatus Lokiarchaeota archaeon]
MGEEILKFTKLTFIIHFIIGLVFTILFWIPDITSPILGIERTLDTHAMSLTIGALFAALVVSSLCGIFAKEWKQVRIVVIAEMVWLVAGMVTTIVSFAAFDSVMAVLMIIMSIILLALFLLTFLQQEDKLKPLF